MESPYESEEEDTSVYRDTVDCLQCTRSLTTYRGLHIRLSDNIHEHDILNGAVDKEISAIKAYTTVHAIGLQVVKIPFDCRYLLVHGTIEDVVFMYVVAETNV